MKILLPALLLLPLSGCYLSVNDDDDLHSSHHRTHCSVSCAEANASATCPKDQVAVCSCEPAPSATCSNTGKKS